MNFIRAFLQRRLLKKFRRTDIKLVDDLLHDACARLAAGETDESYALLQEARKVVRGIMENDKTLFSE
ncbi:MAG: hypothetical protein ACREP6_12525 [Candidatus Binataceae bacterium]